MLRSILSSTVQKSRDDPREVVGVFSAVRGLLTTKGTTGLLLVGETGSSATTHRLKTSKHFERRAMGECIVLMQS